MRLKTYKIDVPFTFLRKTDDVCCGDGRIHERRVVRNGDTKRTEGTYCHKGYIYRFVTYGDDVGKNIRTAIRTTHQAVAIVFVLFLFVLMVVFSFVTSIAFWWMLWK